MQVLRNLEMPASWKNGKKGKLNIRNRAPFFFSFSLTFLKKYHFLDIVYLEDTEEHKNNTEDNKDSSDGDHRVVPALCKVPGKEWC
jgi:hypothetical protein